ncbi:hypothetical protein EYF80_034355 [Liparis tanakae]|uniref:Uncharacterized protein n=1 Tax=Liparis tanakae TaxID=230148 RepID=A0A4Z2GQN2_9TELE|nr:hypothetical protein EYF80_034355 [Liparis tanakae]
MRFPAEEPLGPSSSSRWRRHREAAGKAIPLFTLRLFGALVPMRCYQSTSSGRGQEFVVRQPSRSSEAEALGFRPIASADDFIDQISPLSDARRSPPASSSSSSISLLLDTSRFPNAPRSSPRHAGTASYYSVMQL